MQVEIGMLRKVARRQCLSERGTGGMLTVMGSYKGARYHDPQKRKKRGEKREKQRENGK